MESGFGGKPDGRRIEPEPPLLTRSGSRATEFAVMHETTHVRDVLM
jgi:hypothetical protein